ncbi:MAG: hypothetical protein AB1545_14035 [Thermodesulfobacteriota bacterium]
MEVAIDRLSHITTLLDEVLFQSSIDDMRRAYFHHLKDLDSWMILSDYYLGNEKTNKVITFTVLPYLGAVPQLQTIIRALAPKDIKHTRSIDARLIEFLRQLPILNVSFIFQQDKYFAWTNSSEFQLYMAEFCEILSAYVAFWRQDTTNHTRLDKLSRNILFAQGLLRQKKKIRLLCEAFLISMLGGYVASIVCREAALTNLCWLSDRDRTNELGDNLVRDFFQVTLVDIVKKNISFSFTTANSDSDEWYTELTRIPDLITGTVAGFDFDNSGNHMIKPAAWSVIGAYLANNKSDSFIYRFHVSSEGVKVQRMMITMKTT